MKILVTGVAGFIGSNLTLRLLNEGHTVVGIDNFDPFYDRSIKERNIDKFRSDSLFTLIEDDINHIERYSSILNDTELVIHLAAKAGVRPSIDNPDAYIQSNIRGTQAILDLCNTKSIKKLIFASSSSIYGNNQTPFSESDNVDKPISPYAFTKKCCELMLATYYHLYQIDYIALCFFTVYGPGQRPDLAINKFVSLAQTGQPITIFGDGSTGRDYTYIDDIVEGIFSSKNYLLSNNGVNEIINLGNQSPVLLKDMVATIYRTLNLEPNLKYEPMQAGDVDFTYANIEKAKKLLNYSPSTSFEDGIAKFIKWKRES